MLDPISLFTWEPHVDQRTLRADTLVVTMGSYMDAGHSQRLIDSYLLDQLPNRVVGRFDADQLVDYAGHRPQIVFDRDHFGDYQPPEIALRLVTDHDGRDFLMLTGPEPSLQWERMAAGVRHLIDQLDVRQTYLVQSMPAPAVHTRPTVVTRFASDPELVSDDVPMIGTFQLSASFTGVLTLRLGEAGQPVVGLLAHVPHYIADNDYPDAARALLEGLKRDAHLALPTDGFDLASAAVRNQIDQQVAESPELQAMIEALEGNHDRYLEEHRVRSARNEQLPSADEIGLQFEQFLADLDEDPDPGAKPDSAGGDTPDEPDDPDAPAPRG